MRIAVKHLMEGMTIDLEELYEQTHDVGALQEEIETEDMSEEAETYACILDEFSMVEMVEYVGEGQYRVKTDHWTFEKDGDYLVPMEESSYTASGVPRGYRWSDELEGVIVPIKESFPEQEEEKPEQPNGAKMWRVRLTEEGRLAINHHRDSLFVWSQKGRREYDVYPGVTADRALVFADEVGGEPVNYKEMTGVSTWDFTELPASWWTKAVPMSGSWPSEEEVPGAAVVTHQGVRQLANDDDIQ